ncbi:MAG: SAM-dependent methyltransferase [Micrococcales bacterium]|nr:MAG: SAM-dependent methyltransferase [Micrococcales bacterium]PIE28224.1 MAG: SAM-dependent methyltransferase [Micrococcales bacterium]
MSASQDYWDQVAPRYDAMSAFLERRVLVRGRRWAVQRARGRVLEVGIGTGTNVPLYGAAVELIGIDPSEGMLAQARSKMTTLVTSRSGSAEQADGSAPSAARLPSVQLYRADGHALPFEDATFDAVVSTYVLCSVHDPEQVLAEAVRVLRPGGDLLLADHVASTSRAVRLGQRALERWMRKTSDERLTRRPMDLLAGLGLETVDSTRRIAGVLETVHARSMT